MPRIEVLIVHDEFGQIVAINRLAEGIQADILSGDGESVLVTEVEEENVGDLIGTHRVNLAQKTLERY